MARSIFRNMDVDSTPPPGELPVAEHRYRWDRPYDPREDGSLQEWRESVPYKAGEVVWVAVGAVTPKRAFITHVFSTRDRYGERRAQFRVRYETKAGTWSKQWNYTWPGPIQRGYALAGLAPDVPQEEWIRF